MRLNNNNNTGGDSVKKLNNKSENKRPGVLIDQEKSANATAAIEPQLLSPHTISNTDTVQDPDVP